MDIERWNQRYLEEREIGPPVSLVCDIAKTLRPGRALDLACGPGRNALWLAQNGWEVTAVDGAAAAIAKLEGKRIHAIVADLEAGEYKIEEGAWDLIVISYYLLRNLFEPAKEGLRPGGVLAAVVLISAPGEEAKSHRLKPGELIQYFEGWEILHHFEGTPKDGSTHRCIAEVVARKPVY
jgi:tellurite methyltransferase